MVRWQIWATARGVQAMPADPEAGAAYLIEPAESAAPATVGMDCAAIAEPTPYRIRGSVSP